MHNVTHLAVVELILAGLVTIVCIRVVRIRLVRFSRSPVIAATLRPVFACLGTCRSLVGIRLASRIVLSRRYALAALTYKRPNVTKTDLPEDYRCDYDTN